jgi:hypothetical protein
MIILNRAQALRRALAVLLCGVYAGAVLAAPLTTSPRPLMKPELASQATPAEATAEVAAETPPDPQAEARAALLAQQIESASALAIALSQRPLARPEGLKTVLATPEPPAEVPPAASIPQPIERGQLCGIAGLEGRQIADVPAKSRGCGLEEGVQVTAVSGIPLSTPATIDCVTAQALKTWVDTGIVPIIGTTGGGVKRLEIAASYVCRPRNNQKGAKVSEHGRGRAVDLSGITLKDGRTLTVLHDWKRNAKIMTAIHRAACGTFGTVLGPKSDRYHHDHFHVDTARYRSGAYCR